MRKCEMSSRGEGDVAAGFSHSPRQALLDGLSAASHRMLVRTTVFTAALLHCRRRRSVVARKRREERREGRKEREKKRTNRTQRTKNKEGRSSRANRVSKLLAVCVKSNASVDSRARIANIVDPFVRAVVITEVDVAEGIEGLPRFTPARTGRAVDGGRGDSDTVVYRKRGQERKQEKKEEDVDVQSARFP
jgi:hypothetical protein